MTLPAYSALLGAAVPKERQARTFTLQFALTPAMTAGMWAGPLLAAAATAAGEEWLLFAAAVALLAVVAGRQWPQASRSASGTPGSARRSRSTARPA